MFEVITSDFGSFNWIADQYLTSAGADHFKQQELDSGDITDERQAWTEEH
ncbi:MAG: hypothetical protein HYY52_00040 [Candidatus Melainabacteria bacterium]|nr:hypothetical protein [Candidatus Melainabacteria bacterium]